MSNAWRGRVAWAFILLALAVATPTVQASLITVNELDGVNGSWDLHIVNSSTATLTFINSFTTTINHNSLSPPNWKDTIFGTFTINRTPNADGSFTTTGTVAETIFSGFSGGSPMANFTLSSGNLSGSSNPLVFGLAGTKSLTGQADPSVTGFDFSPFSAGGTYVFSLQGSQSMGAFLLNPASTGDITGSASFTEVAVPAPPSVLLMSIGSVLFGTCRLLRKRM